jgi:hypothetical protein
MVRPAIYDKTARRCACVGKVGNRDGIHGGSIRRPMGVDQLFAATYHMIFRMDHDTMPAAQRPNHIADRVENAVRALITGGAGFIGSHLASIYCKWVTMWSSWTTCRPGLSRTWIR